MAGPDPKWLNLLSFQDHNQKESVLHMCFILQPDVVPTASSSFLELLIIRAHDFDEEEPEKMEVTTGSRANIAMCPSVCVA